MQYKKTAFSFLITGVAIVIAAGIYLATATPVSAQCGSQASSCKNCHETQGQKSVNADGTGWHQSHAFGDFCYICHAGNNQATDKTAAHEGMVAPLSDIKASCQQCHAADLQARAQVYATTLGVKIGSGSSVPASGGTPGAAPANTATVPIPSAASNQGSNQIVVDDPNTINYAQNYDEIVLGKKPVNWGNIIFGVIIVLLVVFGGGYIIRKEGWVNISFGDTKKVEGEYPTDVIELLPDIAGLKSQARKSLKHVLANPGKADKVLNLIEVVMENDEKEKTK